MLRAPVVVALAALMSLAVGCGEDEGTDASPSDASSDVAVPDAAVSDAVSDVAVPDAVSDVAVPDAVSDVAVPDAAPSDASTSGDADAAAPDAASALGSMSIAELAAALPGKSFLMLNVHVPYAGEIPGTDKNLDYQDVPSIEAFIGANKGADVVLYCYSNSMALTAGKALVADGYTKVRYVDGGLAAWKNAGHPVEFHDN